MPPGHTTKQTLTPYRAELLAAASEAPPYAADLAVGTRHQFDEMVRFGWVAKARDQYVLTSEGRSRLVAAGKAKPTLKLAELAARILVHLRRFEADPEINKERAAPQTRPFFWPSVFRHGAGVAVVYVSYQGPGRALTRAQAAAYLAALDAGFVGTHYEAIRARRVPKVGPK